MNHVVGIADMKVSTNAADTITTHALGSCLAVTVYDPAACVGGMVHVMLPLSKIQREKAEKNPCTFVDTGVPLLFTECFKAGAEKQRVIVKVVGGASIRTFEGNDYFQIGESNFALLSKLLRKNGILMKAHDVGGTHWRTVSLSLGDGRVTVTTEEKQVVL
jgi:chemotaxis protein CheD